MASRYLIEGGTDKILLEAGAGFLLIDAPALIEAAGITTAEAVGTPTAVSVNIATAGIATGAAIGQAAIKAEIPAVGIATAQASGAPTVKISIAAAGIATGEAIGQPSLPGPPVDIDCAGIPSEEAVGGPYVFFLSGNATGGSPSYEELAYVEPHTVHVAGIRSAFAAGRPTLRWSQMLRMSGIETQSALSKPDMIWQIPPLIRRRQREEDELLVLLEAA